MQLENISKISELVKDTAHCPVSPREIKFLALEVKN